MNAMHPDEDTLERFAVDECEPGVSTAVSAHVGECRSCAETLETIRLVGAELGSAETWLAMEVEAPREVPDHLLRTLESLRLEDQVADYLLEPLLRNPDGIERAVLELDGRYRTAGVIRRLLAASTAAREDLPGNALAFANAAVVLAEQIPADRYDDGMRSSLRASAWRERANSLRFLGRYPEALIATDHAEAALTNAPMAELEQARLDYVRSSIFQKMESWDDALKFSRRAAVVFRAYGETDREVAAGLIEGGSYFDAGQHAAAAKVFAGLLPLAESTGSAASVGYVSHALANAYHELGDIAAAAPLYQRALAEYELAGMELEKLRTSWCLGLLSAKLGNRAAAIRQLTQAAEGFAKRGCLSDSSLITLHLVEQHLLAGDRARAAELCRLLPESFARAGMTTSALTALEYLREAAEAGRITPNVVRHVRKYLERLPAQPELLFAPPPQ
jgi:tetratricopeptide (TPR) repeat protein